MKVKIFLLVAAVFLCLSGCSKGCDKETPTEPTPSSLSWGADATVTR
jgi:hypothetical protein